MWLQLNTDDLTWRIFFKANWKNAKYFTWYFKDRDRWSFNSQKDDKMILILAWNTMFTGNWKVLILNFPEWEIRSFLSPKVGGKMIFTDYWEVLVLNCSEMGNTVLLWAKKLMKGTIFTWSFWAFHDILGLGRYDFLCSVKYTIRLLSDGVFHAKSLGKF